MSIDLNETVLAQWEESAREDDREGLAWSCHPQAILAIIAEVRAARASAAASLPCGHDQVTEDAMNRAADEIERLRTTLKQLNTSYEAASYRTSELTVEVGRVRQQGVDDVRLMRGLLEEAHVELSAAREQILRDVALVFADTSDKWEQTRGTDDYDGYAHYAYAEGARVLAAWAEEPSRMDGPLRAAVTRLADRDET